MRRATGIIIGILLGALASGLGVGFFLHKANADREALAAQIRETSEQAQRAREENQRAIEEANNKLRAASIEVSKAQNAIKSLEEERALLTQAEQIDGPSKRTVKWTPVVTLALGASLKVPIGNVIASNDDHALTVARQTPAGTDDARWFSLMPYNPVLEQELRATLATSTPVSYLIDGRLFTGERGVLATTSEQILILRIHQNGQLTHLLWVKNAPGGYDALLDVLSTFRFAS